MGKYLVSLMDTSESGRHYVSELFTRGMAAVVTAPSPQVAARALVEQSNSVTQNSLVRRVDEKLIWLQIIDLETQQLLDLNAVFADDLRMRLKDIKAAIVALEEEVKRCKKTLLPLEKIKMDGLDSLKSLHADLAERLKTLRAEQVQLEKAIETENNSLDQLELAMLDKPGEDDSDDEIIEEDDE